MGGRLRLYATYSLRSLRRGGQRTTLAVFCVAVGVMAVVALRLAATMITVSLTGNVRAANGGDLSVQSVAIPLTSASLASFDDLERRGLITRYLPIGVQTAGLRGPSGSTLRVLTVVLDDPAAYPLAGSAHFTAPPGASFATTLGPADGIDLSRFTADEVGARVGARVRLSIEGGGARDLVVRGIADNRVFVGGRTVAFVDRRTYASLTGRPERYGIVTALTPDPGRAQQAAQVLRREFPTATVQTVKDALDQNVDTSSQVSTFLEIVGLLALLIGGIGVVNTIQVMLSRRSLEIAVLKTAGYRRRDLYALFGLETGMLGLAGGVIGTSAGVGVSLVVKALVERAFAISLDVVIAPSILATGVAVGLAASLIFGLLPIVRASAIRPQAVLRGLPEGLRPGTRLQSAALYCVLVALFTLLSYTLLGSLTVALVTVVTAIVVIAVLGVLFAGVAWLVGRIPVPERRSPGHALTAAALVIGGLLLTRTATAAGLALLLAGASLVALLAIPRSKRQIAKLALRSLSRARARTSATLVALFVGVFSVGLILVVGLGVRSRLDDAFSHLTDYSVFAIASPHDAPAVTATTAHLPGVTARRVTVDTTVIPQEVGGRPLAAVLATAAPGTRGSEEGFRLFSLSGVEGYDLAAGRLPDIGTSTGRALRSSDAGTDNVLVPADLTRPPFSLTPGDTITVRAGEGAGTATLRVVGFYSPVSTSRSGLSVKLFFRPILGDRGVVASLGGAGVTTIVSLAVDPGHKSAVLHALQRAAPGATVLDIGVLSELVQQFLGNAITLLLAIAALALFAGVVIIANAVALAMLERRREIGILKATGHTSRSVLAQVVIENGIAGALGAVSGMLAVAVATSAIGSRLLGLDIGMGAPVAVAVVAGIIGVTVVVSGAVAWVPARARPLTVLRYE